MPLVSQIWVLGPFVPRASHQGTLRLQRCAVQMGGGVVKPQERQGSNRRSSCGLFVASCLRLHRSLSCDETWSSMQSRRLLGTCLFHRAFCSSQPESRISPKDPKGHLLVLVRVFPSGWCCKTEGKACKPFDCDARPNEMRNGALEGRSARYT